MAFENSLGLTGPVQKFSFGESTSCLPFMSDDGERVEAVRNKQGLCVPFFTVDNFDLCVDEEGSPTGGLCDADPDIPLPNLCERDDVFVPGMGCISPFTQPQDRGIGGLLVGPAPKLPR